MNFHAVGLTDRGLLRPDNEDAFFLSSEQGSISDYPYFLVADGLGGQAGGAEASRLAVDAAAAALRDRALDPPERLIKAYQAGQRAVRSGQRAHRALREMATTLTALLLTPDATWIGNVGDSRTYRLRGDSLTQVSQDHSWVEEQVRAGLLAPEKARFHRYRNIVTRVLGGPEPVEADLFPQTVQAGDRYLLTSDGLFGELPDTTLCILAALPDLARAGEELLEAALGRGGHDNITLILVSLGA
jgi:serine/threonine protein phosphatase PrpC